MNRNERTNMSIGTMALCAALLTATGAEAVTVATVSRVTGRPISTAEQVSGITYAGKVLGKDLFYAVDDTDKKLYPITLNIGSDGSLTSSGITIGTGVLMSGAADAEGCAFDPCSGNLWVSDETGATIREYDVTTGALLRTAPVPTIQKQYYGNYSLEALTIAGDGKSMWTANEEALKVDGLLATNSVGSVVRLTKFVRDSVHDNWTADGQWAYETQPIGTLKDQYTRSGVSGLCALPDGTLLVLERRCYDGGFFPDFEVRIYEVNFSGATDIRNISSLKTATYTKTTKTSRWSYSHGSDMPNYEGICLGPRLSDGSCSLVLISDAGSSAEAGVFTLKLSGLSNIRTMSFVGAEGCEPSGYPYRYVNGTTVTATVPGAGNLYYETNLVTHNSWSLSDGRKGEGSSATFAVTNDDSLVWATKTDNSLPLNAVDSFERITLGTEAGDLQNWSGGGDGWVAAASYTPALPPGYPLSQETHNQVLMVDGEVTRTYDQGLPNGVVLDTMVRATLPTADTPVADVDDTDILAFHFDDEGYPVLQHRAALGDTRCRTRLTDSVCTNGQWLRVTIAITNVSNTTWCQVRIDGSTCVTPYGALSPTRPGSLGSWHKALSAKTKVSSLLLKGTGAVDDVTLYTPTGKPEFNGTGYVDGVSKEDLWDNALPFVATHLDEDFDGDSVSNRRELEKGTDPWDKSSHPVIPTVFFGK